MSGRRTKAYWLPFATVAVSLLLSACSPSGPPVHFIVPDGFRGEIKLIEDATAVPIRKLPDYYEIIVPAKGVLRVRDFTPLARYHSETWKWYSGSEIPRSGQATADGIGWHSGFGSSDGTITYFVGTIGEYQKWADNFGMTQDSKSD